MPGGKKKKGTTDTPPSYEDALRQDFDDGPPFFSDGICMKMIKKYIACSFFRFTMRRLGRLQSTPDADLDIEHHLPYAKSHEKRARVVQADNARVRCYRVFIIFMIFSWLGFAFAIPTSMILTGVFQVEQCRFMSHMIIVYLVVSGVLSLIFLFMRLGLCSCQVCVSCYRDRLPSTSLAMTVCCIEILNFIVLFSLIIWLGVGVYYIFYLQTVNTINRENFDDDTYCNPSVLIPATIFLVLQFLMIPWSILACTSICCGGNRCCCIPEPDELEFPGVTATTPADGGEAATSATAEDGTGTGNGDATPVDDGASYGQ